jgi:branched-chain amino acid transport system substrate-binding protein
MGMQRISEAVCVLVVLALLSVSFSGLEAAPKPIAVGAPLELSGRLAAYGQAAKRGMDMVLSAVGGRVLGRPVEIIYVDVQSDPAVTIAAFHDLLARRRVRFVVGPIGSPIVATAVGVAKQYRPIWIVPGASTTRLEPEVGSEPWFFHSYTYDYHYHAPTAEALKRSLPAGSRYTVGFVYSDDAYGTEHIKFARPLYQNAGFQVTAEEVVKAGGSDFSPALRRVRERNPDILVGIVQTTDGILLTRQVREVQVGARLYVGTVYPALLEWKAAVGDLGEGWVGVSPFILGVNWPADPKYPDLFPSTNELVARFHRTFKRVPTFLDWLGYVGLGQLLIALQRAGTDDPALVQKALKELRLNTPIGVLQYKPSGYGTLNQGFDQMLVFQIQNDKEVVIYPPDVAKGKLIFPAR